MIWGGLRRSEAKRLLVSYCAFKKKVCRDIGLRHAFWNFDLRREVAWGQIFGKHLQQCKAKVPDITKLMRRCLRIHGGLTADKLLKSRRRNGSFWKSDTVSMPLDGARHGGARSCKGRGKLKFRMVSSVSCQRKNVYECKHSILDSNSIFSRWKLIMHLMKTNDRQPLRNAALFAPASGRKARNCRALYQITPSGPSVAWNNRPISFGHEMTGLCREK